MDYFFNYVRTNLNISKQAMYRNTRILTKIGLKEDIENESGN